MSDISKIDSNFEVKAKLEENDIRFYDVKQAPFKVYGVAYDSGRFRRIPEHVAQTLSRGVKALHAKGAGGRVRFCTDSPYVAIHANLPRIYRMSHFPLTGSAGFDLYTMQEEGERYYKTFVPPYNMEDGFESIIRFDSAQMREITINFPLYSIVGELFIGLQENATVSPHRPYKIEKPVVYYGSSITQGGCASRPGNSYESILSRRFDCNYINLGFSGNAKGEDVVAEYISGLDMSVFVYDYDHNAPSAEHLQNTHERMFLRIREKNQNLPIIILPRPKFHLTKKDEERRDIIKATYLNAKARGDKNVYFIENRDLMALAGNEGTVDAAHPNDLGFYSMAKAVGDVMEKIFSPDK